MKHIDENKLWDYIMGEAEPETAKRVEQHLSSCPKCKHRYNVLLQFHNELHHIDEDVPSLGFSKKVIHTIERDLRLEKRVQFWLRFGKIAVINAIAIAVALPLLMLAFQKVTVSVDGQMLYKVVLPLLSVCLVLWLFYVIDIVLKRRYSS